MATMWPRKIPYWVLSDKRRSSEIQVFNLLEKSLDERWEVYYSRPWWGLNSKGGEVDGEADFIVAHPEKGLLFIEVKGGRIKYDPKRSQWLSVDRDNINHKIKDPVNQAMVCKHKFINRLLKELDWPDGYIRFRHGVVFPGCDEAGNEKSALGGYDRQLFCLSNEFDSGFKHWIEKRLSSNLKGDEGEDSPGAIGLNVLRRLEADPVELHVPLKKILSSENSQMEQLLTSQQLFTITLLEDLPRAIIEGGAGTGKTLLAVEMAIRLSSSGENVCLVCYNAPLAKWLETRLEKYPNVSVFTFHSLCQDLVKSAGSSCNGSGQEFYNEILPRKALKHIQETKTLKKWDVILIDEGQDFEDHWWGVVEELIKNKESGRLRVFYDSNQSLYNRSSDLSLLLQAQVYPLRHNLRNTKKISKVTDHLYSGPLIFPVGPDGEFPVVQYLKHSDSWCSAKDLIVEFVKDQNVVKNDIAVLFSGQSEAEKFRNFLSDYGIEASSADDYAHNSVTVDTIRRFKGLESAIVVLVVNRNTISGNEMAYVAVSRAKSRLFVFGEIQGSELDNAVISSTNTS